MNLNNTYENKDNVGERNEGIDQMELVKESELCVGNSEWLSEIKVVVNNLSANEIAQETIKSNMLARQEVIDKLLTELAVEQEQQACLDEELSVKVEEYLTLKISLKELSDR